MEAMVQFLACLTRELLQGHKEDLIRVKWGRKVCIRGILKVHLSFLWVGMGGCDNLCRWGRISLLEFHKKSRYNAKRGGNVDAMGVLTSQLHDGLAAPTLRNPVPVGLYVTCIVDFIKACGRFSCLYACNGMGIIRDKIQQRKSIWYG